MNELLKEAFPEADAGIQPFGSRVLVQIRTPKKKTASGIIIDLGSQDAERWNTQVAKIIALGPLAFKNRDTMKEWPEGNWCKEGEFVRVGKYGGDRFNVVAADGEESLFVIFNDLDIIGRITGDPLAVKAFL